MTEPTLTQLAPTTAFAPLLPALSELLRDAVAGGASIGWVHVPPVAAAEAFWHGVAAEVAAGRTLMWVASADGRIIGSVQLQLGQKENGSHRGEICKLLVHSGWRQRGVGATLLAAAELTAWQRGLALLFLDTISDGNAERLYHRLGWQTAGRIPAFARSTTGVLEPTTVMYKLSPGTA